MYLFDPGFEYSLQGTQRVIILIKFRQEAPGRLEGLQGNIEKITGDGGGQGNQWRDKGVVGQASQPGNINGCSQLVSFQVIQRNKELFTHDICSVRPSPVGCIL